MALRDSRYDIRDEALAPAGQDLIEWAAREMPVLLLIRERFERERPLEGLRVSASLHVTSETANLMLTLGTAGADVTLCASNPLSTNDAVAAALATSFGINTFARRGEDTSDYYAHLGAGLDHRPHITLDDGVRFCSTRRAAEAGASQTSDERRENRTQGSAGEFASLACSLDVRLERRALRAQSGVVAGGVAVCGCGAVDGDVVKSAMVARRRVPQGPWLQLNGNAGGPPC